MKMRSSKLKCNSQQRGMTLIEVLVALMVFSYAAITLVTASSTNLSSQARLRDKTFANWVAQNQLTEFILEYDPASKKKSSKSDKAEMAGQTFYYKIKVEDAGSEWLNTVRVEVSSDEDMEYLITTLTGFVEKP